MFEKTGCLITADGSGDDKIESEGLPDTSDSILPTYNYIKVALAIPETPTCEPAAEPDDLQVLARCCSCI